MRQLRAGNGREDRNELPDRTLHRVGCLPDLRLYASDGIYGITAALPRHDGPNDLATLRAAVEEVAR